MDIYALYIYKYNFFSTQSNINVATIQVPAKLGLTFVNLNGGHLSQKLAKWYVVSMSIMTYCI